MKSNSLLKKLNEAEYGSGNLRLIQKLDEAEDVENQASDFWTGTKGNNEQKLGNNDKLDKALTNVGGTSKNGLQAIFDLIRDSMKMVDMSKDDQNRFEQVVNNIANLTKIISLPDINAIFDVLKTKGFDALNPPVMDLRNLAALASTGDPADINDLKCVVNLLTLKKEKQLNPDKLFKGKTAIRSSIKDQIGGKNTNIQNNFIRSTIGQNIMNLTNAKKNGTAIGPGEIFMALMFRDMKLPDSRKTADGVASDLYWYTNKSLIEIKGNNGTIPSKNDSIKSLTSTITHLLGRGSHKNSNKLDDEQNINDQKKRQKKSNSRSTNEAGHSDINSSVTPELVKSLYGNGPIPNLAEKINLEDQEIKKIIPKADLPAIEIFNNLANFILSEYIESFSNDLTVMFLDNNDVHNGFPFLICHDAEQIMNFVNKKIFKLKFQPTFNKGDIRLCISWDSLI